MMKNLDYVLEYVIRHLKLNKVFANMVEHFIKDKVEIASDNIDEQIKQIYTPSNYNCKNKGVVVSHDYQLQIIIPCFNCGKYIADCIDSILSQNTTVSYSVMIIDDGSEDNTLDIVKKYAESDSRVKCLSIPHSGAAAARNEALKTINAEYVMFVDGDDLLKPNSIEVLMQNALMNDSDVVEGGYETFSSSVDNVYLHKAEILLTTTASMWGFSCVKVIRAELFYDLCFPSGYWYEDTIIFYLVYTRCHKIQTIEEVVYSYRNNRKGMSRLRGSDLKFLDAYWVLNYTIREMVQRKIYVTQEIYEQILRSILTAGKRMMCLDKKTNRLVLNLWNKLLKELCSEYKTENVELKGFEKAILMNDYRKYQLFVICLG